MKTHQLIDCLLDQWEDWVECNPHAPLDSFISNHFGDVSSDVVALFTAKASQLICIDQKLDLVSSVGDSVSPDETARELRLAALAPGVSPVSGYTLLSRLGGGGFGEVWKAVGPGDFLVALKFVPTDNKAGRIESRSLDVIRDIRHANLLSYVGSWTVGKLLIIATELADKTLLDRLHEEQAAGHRGIGTNELLDYMSEAAKGIDFLNEPKIVGRLRIQHRDIKPQNLLLSGGSVKVGDFGLARAFQFDATGHTGSMTLAYAAPECFDGTTSYRSDQYSLAITYCYLRSGRLPFNGTQFEIIEGHRSKLPDLSMLSECERSSVARALEKAPSDRWPSSSEFVSALRLDVENGNLPKATARPALGPKVRRRVFWTASCLAFAGFLCFFPTLASFFGSTNNNSKLDTNTETAIPAADNSAPRTLTLDSEALAEPGSLRTSTGTVTKQDLGPKSIKNETVTAEDFQDFLADPK